MKAVAKRCEVHSEKEKMIYYQTFKGHVFDCLKILRCYYEKNQGTIIAFCKKWKINPACFMRNLFVTVYLHDIGKLTNQFQKRIRENKRSHMYPHPFFGFPIAFEIFKTKISSVYTIGGYPVVESLAVLSHHTQLHKSVYRDAEIRRVIPQAQEMLAFINDIQNVYLQLGFAEFFEFDWNKCEKMSAVELLKNENAPNNIRKLIHPSSTYDSIKDKTKNITLDEKIKIKSIYTFFLSIVKLCDFYSSAHFSDSCMRNLPEERMLESVMDIPQEYVLVPPELSVDCTLGGNLPYHFQSKMYMEAAPYSFLFAPCGRGKTEAALLWAFNICKKLDKNKIIFAMPTQTTSNALLDRFRKKLDDAGFSGKDLVGLYHGKSFVKLKEELLREKKDEVDTDELDQDDIEEIKSERFKGNIFFKPITVTTIDHLILSFLHGFPQGDFACGNVQNAVIVFDEIHYYELQTLKHLADLFVVLHKMGIPHLLMSGTLPEFIGTWLKENSQATYSLVRDEEGLSFTPFKIEVFDIPLLKEGIVTPDVVEEIKKNYSKNLNQFIILNTVRRAQQFYRIISKEVDKKSVYLVHSQFTYSDRTAKEDELLEMLREKKKRPLIVVSTQVIEISLDISCDIMYTELAPIDSLGQRAGRLNRQGTSWKANSHEFLMKVYSPEKSLPYSETILEKTKNLLPHGVHSYQSLKKVCDAVYGQEYLEEFEREGYLEGAYCLLQCGGKPSLFKECFLFGPKYNRIAFSEEVGSHFVIRTSNYRKLEVVPEVYYENKVENLTVENLVQVPYWWIYMDHSMHGDELQWFHIEDRQFKWKKKLYCICRLPYSKDYGFDDAMLEEENERMGTIENVF